MAVLSDVDVKSVRAPARTDRALAARAASLVLVVPAAVAFTLLFLYPLGRILVISLTQPKVGFGHYAEILSDGYTVRIVVRTLWMALGVAVLDILMAFPFAYAMTIVGRRTRAVLFTIVLIPFWTSGIAKTFAWVIVFQRGGVLDDLLSAVGVHYPLIRTLPAVLIAMSQVLLPFAVLPLYASLDQIDRRLLDAAQGLGATRAASFRLVYLPQAVPGLASALTLTFILSLGFYITPAMLGSTQQTLIAQLIMIRIQQVLDFGGADAMGIFLLLVTIAMLVLSRQLSTRAARNSSSSGGGIMSRIGGGS